MGSVRHARDALVAALQVVDTFRLVCLHGGADDLQLLKVLVVHRSTMSYLVNAIDIV